MGTGQDGRINVVLIGGGMISREVILPTLFQERRKGKINNVMVVTQRSRTIKEIQRLFPKEKFLSYPDPAKVSDENKPYPNCYLNALDELQEEPAIVIVATPDHFHTPVILAALNKNLDVIVQKPLCLKTSEVHQIQKEAEERGLYVYTDYHKRHDLAVRAAKYRYLSGGLGEILYGHAWIEEKIEMPIKNFAAWSGKSSPFEYIGVHYADAYYFITGLKPKRLVAFAQKKLLPTMGKDTYDAVEAVIEWENGSTFWIQTCWIFPQSNSALTNQGLQLVGTKGEYKGDHKDRHIYFVTEKGGYEHYNPNFFKSYNSWDSSEEVEWIGYGYDSLVQGIDDVREIYQRCQGLSQMAKLKRRREILKRFKETRPLPEQALIGTAIIEGVRLSFEHKGRWVRFKKDLTPVLV